MVYENNNGERPFLGSSQEDIPIQNLPKNNKHKQNIHDTSDPFWFHHNGILFQQNRLIEFFPVNELSYAEKLNSTMRFSIYASIALIIYGKHIWSLLLPIITAFITIYLENTHKRQYWRDTPEDCTPSTITNPFMNVLMTDYTENPDRPQACNEPEKVISKNFERNLYQNSFDDIYGKNYSRRQFYTMPVTDIEQSDYDNYINWLYNAGPTCKTDNSKCDVYLDVRYKRRPIRYTPN